MRTRKVGIVFVALGALLVVAAAALLIYNKIDDENAGEASGKVMSVIRDQVVDDGLLKDDSEDSLLLPAGTFGVDPMTTEVIDGYEYIGFLTIPALDIELPVMSEWDYARLRIAPCRQMGSVRTDDLVIVAHNYNEHFGRLHNLAYGDLMLFTDMDGRTTAYAVTGIEILKPTQVDEILGGDWDVTLYTCTYGGASRVTVRFSEIDPELAEKILQRDA